MRAAELFSWPESLPFAAYFDMEAAPWSWLPRIKEALAEFDFSHAPTPRKIPSGVQVEGQVFLHPSVKLPPFAAIQGPCWIGPNVEIRPGAYVRGNVIVGAGSILGNSSEYKNCLLLEGVQTPHYNYVGDSILGNKAHLGAGVICANLRLDQREVVVRIGSQRFATGLRKLGAIVGDQAEAGCNSVLQPGTILGPRSAVISMAFSGYLPEGKVAMPKVDIAIFDRED